MKEGHTLTHDARRHVSSMSKQSPFSFDLSLRQSCIRSDREYFMNIISDPNCKLFFPFSIFFASHKLLSYSMTLKAKFVGRPKVDLNFRPVAFLSFIIIKILYSFHFAKTARVTYINIEYKYYGSTAISFLKSFLDEFHQRCVDRACVCTLRMTVFFAVSFPFFARREREREREKGQVRLQPGQQMQRIWARTVVSRLIF